MVCAHHRRLPRRIFIFELETKAPCISAHPSICTLPQCFQDRSSGPASTPGGRFRRLSSYHSPRTSPPSRTRQNLIMSPRFLRMRPHIPHLPRAIRSAQKSFNNRHRDRKVHRRFLNFPHRPQSLHQLQTHLFPTPFASFYLSSAPKDRTISQHTFMADHISSPKAIHCDYRFLCTTSVRVMCYD